MDICKSYSALLMLAHGSTVHPESSAPTKSIARSIRESGRFAAVHCAFWKEEPSYRQVIPMIEQDEIYVVPNFISEGYFTKQIIPREMALAGRTTVRAGKRFHYCDPVGSHESMTSLLLAKAESLLPDSAMREDAALIIVGHGTPLNKNSVKAIENQVAALKNRNMGFGEITASYMEEPPFIADWKTQVRSKHVIVIPFFIADGLHSHEDIPEMLGIAPLSPGSEAVYKFGDRTLQYSRAIGTDPRMAGIVIDQVNFFDKNYLLST